MPAISGDVGTIVNWSFVTNERRTHLKSILHTQMAHTPILHRQLIKFNLNLASWHWPINHERHGLYTGKDECTNLSHHSKDPIEWMPLVRSRRVEVMMH